MRSYGNVVRRFIEEVLNQGKLDAAGQFFWEDMVEQVPLPGQGPGLEGLKDALRGLRAAFPDMHWTVQEQIAEGNKAGILRFLGREPAYEDDTLDLPFGFDGIDYLMGGVFINRERNTGFGNLTPKEFHRRFFAAIGGKVPAHSQFHAVFGHGKPELCIRALFLLFIVAHRPSLVPS